MKHRLRKLWVCGLMLAAMVCLCAVSASAVTYTNGFGDDGSYEPAQKWGNSYAISNAGQLYWFAQQVNNGNSYLNAHLTSNITVNEGTNLNYSSSTAANPDYRMWTQIGSSSIPYKGTFDGKGLTISGLYYFSDSYGSSSSGIFYSNEGTIKNVKIDNSFFRYGSMGGVLCHSNSGTIQECTIGEKVRIEARSDSGGIVYNNKAGGKIVDCVNRGGGTVGGIVCYNSGDIEHCENYTAATEGGICANNSGRIQSCTNYAGLYNNSGMGGGICGYNEGFINYCTNEGAVIVEGMMAGGIVGSNRGTVRKCVNTADIQASSTYSGGIVGSNSGDTLGRSRIEYCYNTGDVLSSAGYCGGIVGGNYGIVSSCYSTGQAYVSYPNTGYICGKNGSVSSSVGSNTVLYYQNGSVSRCFFTGGSSDSQGIGSSDSGATSRQVVAYRNLSGDPGAYFLNGGNTLWGVEWHQNVDNGRPVDPYPILDAGSGIVYYVDGSYTNTKPDTEEEPGVLASGRWSGGTWVIDDYDTLTITGEGTMPNYLPLCSPWYPWRETVRKVVLDGTIPNVGNYAFQDFEQLTEVQLDSATGTIGDWAFVNCTALERICIGSISSTNSKIGRFAFGGCTALEEVSFPSTATLDNGAFYGCAALRSIYFNNWVKYPTISAGVYTFRDVTATLYYPQGSYTPSISGDHAGTIEVQSTTEGPCGFDTRWSFDTATGVLTLSGTGAPTTYWAGSFVPWHGVYDTMTSIVVEEGITDLPRYTFEFAEKVKTVSLPSTLTRLAANAFNDCRALNNLLIPAGVTEFEEGRNFNRCDALTDVYYLGTAQEWAEIPNADASINSVNNPNLITLHCLTAYGTEPTCTEPGVETYYSFSAPTVYPSLYDIDKKELSSPRKLPPKGHTSVKVPAVAATCTSTGLTEGEDCSVCGATLTAQKVVPMLSHTLTETERVAATCTADGHVTKTCKNCPYSETSTLTKLGHSYTAKVTLPTCTEKGYTTHTCSRCKSGYTDSEVKATGHSYGSWTQTKAPTCTAKGSEKQICSKCSDVVTREIAALGHSYVDKVTAPTCTEKGYTTHTCSRCRIGFTDSEVKATGHSYGSWTQTKAPTCTAKGSEKQTCSKCSDVVTREIAALGHSYVDEVTAPTCTAKGYTTHTCSTCSSAHVDTYVNAKGHTEVTVTGKAATCTAAGLSDGAKCSVCGVVTKKQETIAALGHSWGEWKQTKAPTEAAEGEKTRTCSRCKTTETESIPKLSHTHSYTSVVKAPTCTEKGYTTHTCKCGHSYVDTYVNAKGHTAVTVTGKAATCTATGLTDGGKCSVCGVVTKKQETIAALGHSWGEWKQTKAPTEAAEGEKTRTCSRCKTTETESIPKLSHTHSYTSVVTAPTCTEKGYTTHTCSCGHSYVDTYVNAKGHTEVTVTGKAATCTAAGLTDGAKCSVCGVVTKKQETIAALGHTEVTVTGKAATCTAAGLSDGGKCSVCGVVTKKQETIAALGHSWGEWKQTKAPTEAAEGEKTRTCSRCKTTETASIPKLNHTHSYTSVVTAPTCTEKGYTTHTCSCGHSYVDNETDATGHTAKMVFNRPATCTQDGVKLGTVCSVCDEVLSGAVPATGHTWGDWEVVKAPTATEKGEDQRVCATCGETETRETQPTTHRYERVVTEPTCTEQGYTTYTCVDCGHSYVDDYVDAVGHKRTPTTKLPTCTEPGFLSGIKCSVCDRILSTHMPMPAKGHSWETVTENGVACKKCTACGETQSVCEVVLTGNTLQITLDDRPDTLWICAVSYNTAGGIKELKFVEVTADQVTIAFGDTAQTQRIQVFFLGDSLIPWQNTVTVPVS